MYFPCCCFCFLDLCITTRGFVYQISCGSTAVLTHSGNSGSKLSWQAEGAIVFNQCMCPVVRTALLICDMRCNSVETDSLSDMQSSTHLMKGFNNNWVVRPTREHDKITNVASCAPLQPLQLSTLMSTSLNRTA